MKSIKKISLATALLFSVTNLFSISKATDPTAKEIASHEVAVVLFTGAFLTRDLTNKVVDGIHEQMVRLRKTNKNPKVTYIIECLDTALGLDYYAKLYDITLGPLSIVFYKNGKKIEEISLMYDDVIDTYVTHLLK